MLFKDVSTAEVNTESDKMRKWEYKRCHGLFEGTIAGIL
jgi:hypothetical protein